MDLPDLRHEHFADRIGEPFEVRLDDGAGGRREIELRLTAATRAAGDRPDDAHFVEWTGPAATMLQQGVYEMHHAELGTLPLFIVPVHQHDDGIVYEAVFTRVDG